MALSTSQLLLLLFCIISMFSQMPPTLAGRSRINLPDKLQSSTPTFISSSKEPASADPATTSSIDGSTSFPGIFHSRKVLLKEDASQAPASDRLSGLQTKVITRNQSVGEFYTVLQVGTPPVDMVVVIDTASGLFWIQCEPCDGCNQPADSYRTFKPNESSTFTSSQCASDDDCPRVEGNTVCNNETHMCEFDIMYGDASKSAGYLLMDTLSLIDGSSAASSAYQKKELVLGCSLDNSGMVTKIQASGIMGLDRDPFSLTSQLDLEMFAYCFPDRTTSSQSLDHLSGYLTLNSPQTSPSTIKYTPMLFNEAEPSRNHFYYMNMTGISINDNLLDNIPSSAFQMVDASDPYSSGYGGTIIDSGSTLTSFTNEVYSVFADAFAQAMGSSGLSKLDNSQHMLCYEVPIDVNLQEIKSLAPEVTLHFADDLHLDIDSAHSMVRAGQNDTHAYYCMAFSNTGPMRWGGLNIVGNYHQQNLHVEYDIARSRIGFAPADCAASNSK